MLAQVWEGPLSWGVLSGKVNCIWLTRGETQGQADVGWGISVSGRGFNTKERGRTFVGREPAVIAEELEGTL